MVAYALLSTWSGSVRAGPATGIFTPTIETRNYSRFGTAQTESTVMKLGLSIEGGLQFRLVPSWHLKLMSGKFTSVPMEYFGVGFRVGMPGFFLFAADSSSEFSKKKRTRRVETSMNADLLRVADKSDPVAQLNYFSTRGAFGADIRLVPALELFLKTDIGIQSLKGNLYLSYGIGVGMEF